MLSFCSGVFVLAATGLLDGRRATTHWRYSEASPTPTPRSGQPDVLYVDEGNVLTAAGSAAGIDLCLHLIRRDWGAGRRQQRGAAAGGALAPDGGQAQFIEAPVPQAREGGRLGHVLERMRAEPAGDTTLAKLARAAGMSRRIFMRRFKASTGTTPGAWLANARIARARELFEYTASDIEAIATAAGFGSAATLRHHFRKHVEESPSSYLRRFGYQMPMRAAVPLERSVIRLCRRGHHVSSRTTRIGRVQAAVMGIGVPQLPPLALPAN